MIDGIQLELGNAGISLGSKCVIEFRLYLLQDVGCSIEWHVRLLEIIVGPNIIEAGKVVAMTVCEENGVETTNVFAKHLLPEVRTGVYNNAKACPGSFGACPGFFGAVNFDVDRSAKALVAIVHGTAYVALAPDHGHALGCAGAEERNLQIASFCFLR